VDCTKRRELRAQLLYFPAQLSQRSHDVGRHRFLGGDDGDPANEYDKGDESGVDWSDDGHGRGLGFDFMVDDLTAMRLGTTSIERFL
jgi:hypothetical protein